MFDDKWLKENYPSSEDYKEAKRLGNVVKNRSVMNTPASNKPEKPGFDGRGSVQAHKDKQKKAADKPRNLKGVFFLVAVLMGILPNLSDILDQVTESLNLEALLPQSVTETVQTDTGTSSLGPDVPHIQVAGVANYYKIDASSGIKPAASPDFTELVQSSKFLKTAGADYILNKDGSFQATGSIELVLVDLTNDGTMDALLYFKGQNNGPYIELFYNDGTTFTPLDYYEVYEKIHITENGVIQRLDMDGNVYDEIVIQ